MSFIIHNTFISPCYHWKFQQTETKLCKENFIVSRHDREIMLHLKRGFERFVVFTNRRFMVIHIVYTFLYKLIF